MLVAWDANSKVQLLNMLSELCNTQDKAVYIAVCIQRMLRIVAVYKRNSPANEWNVPILQNVR